MTTQVNLFDVMTVKNRADRFASLFNHYSRLYTQASDERSQFINRHPELEHHHATPLTVGIVVLILVLLVIFQTNTDGAAVAEILFGDLISDSPLFTFGLGLALCLFGFVASKGLNLNYGQEMDAIGRRRLTTNWWVSLLATLIYVGFHIYISLMLYQTGGESGHWAAWLPTFIAFIDVCMSILFGNLTVLVIQRMSRDSRIASLTRKMRMAAQRTGEAVNHYRLLLKFYNDSLQMGELVYEETGNVSQALAYHQNPGIYQLPNATLASAKPLRQS